MTTLKNFIAILAGVLGIACCEGKTVTAYDYPRTIETFGYSLWIPYSNYMYETWSIKTEDDMHVIEIELEFDIEFQYGCIYDSLQIFDGMNSAATSLGLYCGHSSGIMLTSSGQDLHVVFKSDSSLVYRGFKLTYKQVKEKEKIWMIIGIVIAVVIAILSVGLIVCLCWKCKTKDQVTPLRVTYQHHQPQNQPQLWMTPMYYHDHQANVPPPPVYEPSVPSEQPHTYVLQDLDTVGLPSNSANARSGAPPRQNHEKR
ncbi:uncharacterized protein [Argopecten irradians]|uniref:uncharacterized protein n=1 Tax=Argopecten irradians TaxID=31199 RepID=UPI0037117661